MLHIKDVPPEQMPEVVRVAGELYDREQAQAQERRSTVAAAAEMGLPPEYLERAAALVHARRVEQIQGRRRRAVSLVAVAGAGLALWGGWTLAHPRPVPPLTYNFQNPQQVWTENGNPESRARATFGGGGATIHVDHFAPHAGPDSYFVNLDTKDVPKTLAGYRTVSFRVQGQGLPNVRLYLESGGERWRSDPVPVTGAWQAHSLALDQFDHQTRSSPVSAWHRVGESAPGHVERLSFKVGDYVNAVSARGDVRLSDLRFR